MQSDRIMPTAALEGIKSITLDIKHPQGKSLLRRLIKHADVFVENFRPGAIERLDFDYETVHSLNPQLIYAQIKGFGMDGPYANFPAFDPVGQATGGAVSITGEADGPPMRPGPNLADSGAGFHCAMGILAALYQRTITGLGQRIEVAMQDVIINFCRSAYGKQLMNGQPAKRVGNGMPMAEVAPAGLYPCRPGGPNDIVSGLLVSQINNQPIEDEVIAGFVRGLIVAGDRSTANGIASSILHLATHTDLQAQLRREPALVPAAIEEFIRLYAPSHATARTATHETELGGQTIKTGEVVAMVFLAGNRDPEIFPEPDQCILERRPNRHLGFGHGVHKCAGQSLARIWADTAATFYSIYGAPMNASGISITAHGPGGAITGPTPEGRYAGENLADGTVSAAQGKDTNGPTALIRSALAIDQTPYQSNLLNIKFHPSALKTTEDLRKLSALIKTYFAFGGKHIQFNMVNRETLLEAQQHPEKHRDLIVRIAGYSAYFTQLTKRVQDDIIARMEHELAA